MTKNNKLSILYPAHPFKPKYVDESYKEEYDAAQKAGLNVSILDISNIKNSQLYPDIDINNKILYRGWMLPEASYGELEERFSDNLVTTKIDYLNAHHFPNWYYDLTEFTMTSIVTSLTELDKQFKHFQGKVFIKDYVKSLKTRKKSIVENFTDAKQVIDAMNHYRGLIEGGIVLREFVDLQPNTEKRYFIVNDIIFAPDYDNTIHNFAKKIVKKLENKSLKYYSMDIAFLKTGQPILIEIGDGQVSDYVGWQLSEFINVLKYLNSQSY